MIASPRNSDMMSIRTGYLFLVAFLAVALPAAPPAAGASAEAPRTVSLSYNLWEGGLHAFSFETRLNRGDSTYSVNLAARTEGLVKLLYPFKLKARTDGIADEDGLRPTHYRSTSKKGPRITEAPRKSGARSAGRTSPIWRMARSRCG
jgi:hypothetical protein